MWDYFKLQSKFSYLDISHWYILLFYNKGLFFSPGFDNFCPTLPLISSFLMVS